jgi:hypothetical protein
MAKLKNEMQKIHRKKVRKAKERLKSMEKGKLLYSKLDSAARKVFYKRLKAGYEFPGRSRKPAEPAKPSSSA